MTKIDPGAYYSEDEAAAALHRSKHTLRRMRRTTSVLPFSKLGRSILYKGSDLLAALENCRRTSTSN
jgi:hypothetical protein